MQHPGDRHRGKIDSSNLQAVQRNLLRLRGRNHGLLAQKITPGVLPCFHQVLRRALPGHGKTPAGLIEPCQDFFGLQGDQQLYGIQLRLAKKGEDRICNASNF